MKNNNKDKDEQKMTGDPAFGFQREYQTRSEENGLEFFPTAAEAFEHAEMDKTVWKISWQETETKRVRLVRTCDYDGWHYEPMDRAIEKIQREEARRCDESQHLVCNYCKKKITDSNDLAWYGQISFHMKCMLKISNAIEQCPPVPLYVQKNTKKRGKK